MQKLLLLLQLPCFVLCCAVAVFQQHCLTARPVFDERVVHVDGLSIGNDVRHCVDGLLVGVHGQMCLQVARVAHGHQQGHKHPEQVDEATR